jgi:4-hydroxy-tetrahydrodipicolinate synthase
LFSGIYQILHTPFDETGKIDWKSYQTQIRYCLDAGVHGLVTSAMASEFFTLSDQERFDVVEFALSEIAGRVPTIVGVQGVSLPVAMTFAEHAIKHHADGLMAMPPYLRKASKAGVDEYFLTLASLGLPLMIQNAPAPVGSPLGPADLAQLLAAEQNISYVKEETTPILQRISQIKRQAGSDCQGIFGGANGLYLLDELRRGACGNMPAGGMIDLQVKIYNLWTEGKHDKAEDLQLRLLPLLTYAAIYGVTFHKFILWRRGVLRSPYARDPQKIMLDKKDEQAISHYWPLLAEETLETYPFQAQG